MVESYGCTVSKNTNKRIASIATFTKLRNPATLVNVLARVQMPPSEFRLSLKTYRLLLQPTHTEKRGIMEQPPHPSAGLGDGAAPVLSGELIL